MVTADGDGYVLFDALLWQHRAETWAYVKSSGTGIQGRTIAMDNSFRSIGHLNFGCSSGGLLEIPLECGEWTSTLGDPRRYIPLMNMQPNWPFSVEMALEDNYTQFKASLLSEQLDFLQSPRGNKHNYKSPKAHTNRFLIDI